MILVTGANGQVGRAIIAALLAKGEKVRALVFNAGQAQEIKSLGEMDVVAGDMMDRSLVSAAYGGIDAVYHICSAFNINEVEIGKVAIHAARSAGVKHFVYHSVLHSVLQEMPHHQKKLMVEELVINSGLKYTIIQPAVFMQNIFESWNDLKERGIFRQKFFTNSETRICMLDLIDLAEAASTVLTASTYMGATYELAGPENLSLRDITTALKGHFNREIQVEAPPDALMAELLKKHGAKDYFVSTLLKMFQHYNEHGFVGNPGVLNWILGRKPNDFSAFLTRTLQSE